MQQTKPEQTESPLSTCAADALCSRRGLRLTRVRRLVLEFLLDAKMPVKAYDILDALRHDAPKALTPASIYRALDSLLQEGLVHKVGTLNAYGPEEDFSYPPRPADPRAAWNLEWTARVRHRSI